MSNENSKSDSEVQIIFNELVIDYMRSHKSCTYETVIEKVVESAAIEGNSHIVRYGCIFHKADVNIELLQHVLEKSSTRSQQKEIGQFLYDYLVEQINQKGDDGHDSIATQVSVQQFQLLVNLHIFVDTTGLYVLNWLSQCADTHCNTYLKVMTCWKTIDLGRRSTLRKIEHEFRRLNSDIADEIHALINKSKMTCPPEFTAAEVLAYVQKNSKDENNIYLLEEMIGDYSAHIAKKKRK